MPTAALRRSKARSNRLPPTWRRRTSSADDRVTRATVAAEALRAAVERGAGFRAELAAVKQLGGDQTRPPARAFCRRWRTERRVAWARTHRAVAGVAARAGAAPSNNGGSFLARLEDHAKSRPDHADRRDGGTDRQRFRGGDRAHRSRCRARRLAGGADRYRPAAGGRALACRRLGQEGRSARCGARREPPYRRRRSCRAQQTGLAMIRVVFFLVIVGALALGVAWLADRPADVVITWPWLNQVWPGHGGIKTSLIVLVAAIVVTMAVIALLWSLLSAALRSPFILRRQLHRRRGERAYEAISRGLIAIGAGDLAAARVHAAEVARIAPAEPLALLLSAQSAQLGGDTRSGRRALPGDGGPRRHQGARTSRPLSSRRRRRGDPTSAHAFAEEAARESPSLGWAGKAVLEFRCLDRRLGRRAGAARTATGARSTKTTYQRQRAVMLTARANATEESDRDSAKAFALEADEAGADLRAGGVARGAACSRSRAICAGRRAYSTRPGAPTRIPNSRRFSRISLRRCGARPPQAHRGAGEENAGPYRRRIGDGARRARRARIRARRVRRSPLIWPRRPSASLC